MPAVERPHHEHVERALVGVAIMRSNTGRTLAALAFYSYSVTSSSPRIETTRSMFGRRFPVWRLPLLTRR